MRSRRNDLAFRQLRAFLQLPFIVLVVVPAALIWHSGLEPGWGLPPPWSGVLLAVSAGSMAVGTALIAHTIGLFQRWGDGTLAPWDPPRRLVVRGAYRHVRNPMLLGVFSLLGGEALAAGCPPLAVWWLIFLLGNGLYLPLIEEPLLAARLGEEYEVYRRNVPRFVPRLRPWFEEEHPADTR